MDSPATRRIDDPDFVDWLDWIDCAWMTGSLLTLVSGFGGLAYLIFSELR